MPTKLHILAVFCTAMFTMTYMLCNKSTSQQALKSSRAVYNSADSPSNLIEKFENGALDTAPFNRISLIPPFLHYITMMEVAPKYKLSACIIEKVMSTTIDSIFCYLTNSTEFTARNRTISTEKAISRMCWKQNRHLGYEGIENKVGLQRKQFVTVRHPMQRFLSGFAEKCARERPRSICLMCKELPCFLEKLHIYLKGFYAANAVKLRPQSFSTHYNYCVAHFAPQNWYCNFYNHFDDYIILRQGENGKDIEAYAQKLENILSDAGVPTHFREEIYKQLLKNNQPAEKMVAEHNITSSNKFIGENHSTNAIKILMQDSRTFNKSDLIPPFLNYRTMMEIAPKYHICACVIEKIMSTTIDAIFCYLTNTTEFTTNRRTISKEDPNTRFCGEQNRYLDYEEAVDKVGSPRMQFVTVRNPLQRFVSGYADKCVREAKRVKRRCFRCSDNLNCFIEKLYTYLNIYYAEKSRGLLPHRKPHYEYEVVHFAPQNWYCNFYNHFNDYIILRQGEDEEGTMRYAQILWLIFSIANVPDSHTEEIHKQLLIGRSPHATKGSKRRLKVGQTLLNNKTLLTLFTRIYYYDFAFFNFSLPNIS